MTAPARRFTFLPPESVPSIRFEERAGGREMALSGVIELGEVGPCADSGAYWRLWLPGCAQLGRAGSVEKARSQLTAKIEQWIEAADLKSVRA